MLSQFNFIWDCEIWSVSKSLLLLLEAFLHRSIRRVLNITMCQVMDDQIKNSGIRTSVYNIPSVRNPITVRQLTCIGKMLRCEESHIPSHLLTAWYNHIRKAGRPFLTNNNCIVNNLRLIIPKVGDRGSSSLWLFHYLDSIHWYALLQMIINKEIPH